MRRVGIVGHEAAKFTPQSEAEARGIIRDLLAHEVEAMVSGGCHLGGADIYAEEEARALGVAPSVHLPRTLGWPGYKARNLKIADDATEVHVIVVDALPASYRGMRFDYCYHCRGRLDSHREPIPEHVKSGGCWTAWRAVERGKPAFWHVVRNPQ